MKKYTQFLLLIFLSIAPELKAQNLPPEKNASQQNTVAIDSIVVLPVKLAKGIAPKTAELLNEIILSELTQVAPEKIRVIGSSDIREMIGHDKLRYALGCDDSSCLVEIGQALGASHLLQMNLGSLGHQYIVNIKLLATDDATVAFRRVRYVPQSEDQLLQAVKLIIQEMGIKYGWKKTSKVASTLVSQPVMMWGGLAGSTLGLLTMAGFSLWALQDYLQIVATGDQALPRDKQRETAFYGLLKSSGAIVATGLTLFSSYIFARSLFMEETSTDEDE